jgi:large subunit ribosomal protein L35
LAQPRDLLSRCRQQYGTAKAVPVSGQATEFSLLNAKLDIDMPKLKTHKGAAKRFKKTATGKVKRSHAFLRHILTSKEKKRKRGLRSDTLVSKADTPKAKRMIPY